MNALIQGVSNGGWDAGVAGLCLDTLLKSVVVLALAALVCILWRRASAATRHLIWFLAVLSLPFLPVLNFLRPAWQPPLWTVSSDSDSGNRISLALELGPRAVARNKQNLPAPPTISAPDPDSRTGPGAIGARFGAGWMIAAVAVWWAGTAIAIVWVIMGQIRLRWFSRRAQPLSDPEWALLLGQSLETLRLRHSVRLWFSRDEVMPMTWGWVRPVILLPAGAASWPVARRRIVLLHELAHIKRRDWLTQLAAQWACAIYWFHPLVWLALGRMRLERERACDDLVLGAGCKASDYAEQLVGIAGSFWRPARVPAIAMARSTLLEGRVAAIVDASRNRRLRSAGAIAVLGLIGLTAMGLGGTGAGLGRDASREARLRQRQLRQLESFSAAKEKQSEILATAAGEEISPEFRKFFDAAIHGDWRTVTNRYEYFKRHHPQYSQKGGHPDVRLRTSYWQPVLEICLAYDHVVKCDPKYTQMAVDDIIRSIPKDSIYFGGTDPGRGLPTAFCKSQIDADPFYTITQNALADGTYLEYLRETYGRRSALLDRFIKIRRADPDLPIYDSGLRSAMETLSSMRGADPNAPAVLAAERRVGDWRQRIDDRTAGIWAGMEAGAENLQKGTIYVPTVEDSRSCFQEYLADAVKRLHSHQLEPGENVQEESNGRVAVSGQVAVMKINALLAKIIFEKNSGHQFYIEESFPLDWMYPHLEPHGLIFKINRMPLAELPDALIKRDDDYWTGRVQMMIGGWLDRDTPVKAVTRFAERVFARRDLTGFSGDPHFVVNDYACRFFSKERVNTADLYCWREQHATASGQRKRMASEADWAFRQALALCPYSSDAVYRYANFLMAHGRKADALRVAEMALAVAAKIPTPPETAVGYRRLVDTLRQGKQMNSAEPPPIPEQTSAAQTGATQSAGERNVFEMRPVYEMNPAHPVAPPAGTERMTLPWKNDRTGKIHLETLYVENKVLLDQHAIRSAMVETNALGNWEVKIQFTDSGRKQFDDVTRRNIGRRLAIVIDGAVQVAPVIQSEIPNGTAVIQVFSGAEAQALADKINRAVGKQATQN